MRNRDTLAPAAGAGTVLAIIVASYLMIVVDISIVITGLPRIQAELGFSAAQLSWVTNAYTLTFGGLLLLGARAGDILGRRRMFITGLALFTLASIAIGVSPSAAWLLAARAIQGAGAAVLAPSTLALLSTHFAEGPARTRALSMYAAAAGIGATLGLVLGGLFADLVSWRAGFFINLPIGLALIAAARKHIAETPTHVGRFDVAGASSSTLGMTALVYGLVRAAEAGWQDMPAQATLAGGALMLAAFVAIERRVDQPVLPLRLLAHRERAGAYVARMLFMAGAVGFWFFSTQFLQGVLHLRPLQAGLAFLPVTLPNFASAMAVPRLARRHGSEALLLAGLPLGVAGLLWLGQADAHASYWLNVAPPMVLIGLGQGLLLGPLTAAGVAGVAREDAGAASGLVNVAHQLGGALGLGVLVLTFAAAAPATAHDVDTLAHRISAVMNTGALLLALALLVAWACIVMPRRRASHQQETLT
ncbi:MAG TPA: MFS transporter [Burkholderiaceae bacterium]|nr:MFS transporter [Burkholderiaceae bacterium]